MLRAATIVAATAAVGTLAACAPDSSPAPTPGADPSPGPGGSATTVFRNGRVYTVAGPAPWAQAVAVTGNTISYVGDDAGAMALAGPDTTVIDLGGKLLMPGFVEGHTHPFLGAFLTSGVDLQVPTLAEALDAIAAYAKANPTGPVRGFGWRVDMFGPQGPTRADLDRVLPDRPGFFFAIDGHSLWANSKALELAGVSRDTPDPIPGFSYYARDENGEPTGYVLEVNAVLGLVDAVEPISPDTMATLVQGWLPKASAAGITSVFDAGVPPIGDDQAAILRIYTDIEQRNELPIRVAASYSVRGAPIEGTVEKFTAVRDAVSSELVTVGVVKIVGDGTQGGYTAWLIEPYADKPDSTGASPFTEEQWHRLVNDVDAAGYDVHIHACGERTARVGLDAVERAIAANPPRDRRHTIAHLVYVEDSDAPRFAQLGVTAQFSANWMSADPDTIENMGARYGAPRKDLLYRPQAVLGSGGRISLGTDWPAAGYFSTYKPLDSIQIGVTRQLVGKPDAEVLAPADQKLTVEQAVHANTLGAAYQIRLEDKVGSVEVGKLADLIVLDRNIFDIDPHDIHAAEVTMTMMNGQVRHES
ncbi:twin-arginine translocation pathway signal protein [Mycolicibacterium neoaurum]|nr:twin-arginine translocation pathway signal protein [Mycolicibacterium neoaurum VKM Ac-1815D]AMO08461.1 twin-arginine translocation pathway signal protein [Mycolicibacterium neoaurum]AXK78204.1 amidohydrolase [Mycolicibacterium neoaurum]KJQ48859.1 twin-arginine translocation pathway signal protein [Mycolicibacterium neoaurum]KUM07409.1 twin-arginine translocation pathway signal protein [Mycolicibacterium neoaurum]